MAIIGISGKIGSGKDTIGEIIQYLTYREYYGDFLDDGKTPVPEYFPGRKVPYVPGQYVIKKFADELKETIARWIGCTREQLEDREFKETPLSEDWWYYRCETGSLNYSGNEFLLPYLSKPDLTGLYDAELIKQTPRMMLQRLGTEAGRGVIHPNIWVNALFSKYVPKVSYMCDRCMDDDTELVKIPSRFKAEGYDEEKWVCGNCAGEESEGDITKCIVYPNWIITDVRFPNEAEAIKRYGGKVIRVNRDYVSTEDPKHQHSSETALDNYEGFDHIVQNDGTIPELVEKIKALKL